ncbi:MAG TPA: MarR family transcriptional regulator [Candidatus Tumulicola sp.]|jgi:DNA-binding MarR family transcriptional regulator
METAPLAALLRLSTAHAATTRLLDAKIGGHHGLSFAELRLLRVLSGAPEEGLRPTELAATLEITASGVTRTVLPLEKRGILRRRADAGDARASRITLTPAGRTLTADASATAAEGAARLTRRLSLGQTRQLERLLGELT